MPNPDQLGGLHPWGWNRCPDLRLRSARRLVLSVDDGKTRRRESLGCERVLAFRASATRGQGALSVRSTGLNPNRPKRRQDNQRDEDKGRAHREERCNDNGGLPFGCRRGEGSAQEHQPEGREDQSDEGSSSGDPDLDITRRQLGHEQGTGSLGIISGSPRAKVFQRGAGALGPFQTAERALAENGSPPGLVGSKPNVQSRKKGRGRHGRPCWRLGNPVTPEGVGYPRRRSDRERPN